MKIHLYRSERSTWCGLKIADHPNLKVARGITTTDPTLAACKTCVKADEAEQYKQDTQDENDRV